MLVGSMGTAFELGQPLLPVGLRTFNSDSGLVEVLCLNLVYSDSMEHLGPGVSDSPLLLIFVFLCLLLLFVVCLCVCICQFHFWFFHCYLWGLLFVLFSLSLSTLHCLGSEMPKASLAVLVSPINVLSACNHPEACVCYMRSLQVRCVVLAGGGILIPG